MIDGYYAPSYLGLVIDSGRRRQYTLADSVIWTNFLLLYWQGRILAGEALLSRGQTPGLDRDVERNNRGLATLPKPFTAEFVGGKSTEGDGVFAWSQPISLTRTMDNDGIVTTSQATVAPRSVPLEVGSVGTYNTLHRLKLGRQGVARWPYGASTITILVPDDARRDDAGTLAQMLGNDQAG
jgi:hypothetical protein